MRELTSVEIQRCKKLQGTIGRDRGVCWVGNYPAPLYQEDWDFCPPNIVQAIDKEETVVLKLDGDNAEKFYPNIDDVLLGKRLHIVQDRFEKGLPVCPLWRNTCYNTKGSTPEIVIDGHEGRHRIVAGRRAGILKFPVVLRERPKYACEGYF